VGRNGGHGTVIVALLPTILTHGPAVARPFPSVLAEKLDVAIPTADY
jgi:hypothetical protein